MHFEDLPLELLAAVLGELDAKSLGRACLASTRLNTTAVKNSV